VPLEGVLGHGRVEVLKEDLLVAGDGFRGGPAVKQLIGQSGPEPELVANLFHLHLRAGGRFDDERSHPMLADGVVET
jgi:hypothetical protein